MLYHIRFLTLWVGASVEVICGRGAVWSDPIRDGRPLRPASGGGRREWKHGCDSIEAYVALARWMRVQEAEWRIDGDTTLLPYLKVEYPLKVRYLG